MQNGLNSTYKSVVAEADLWSRNPVLDSQVVDFVRNRFGTILTNSERVTESSRSISSFQASSITDYFPGLRERHALNLAEPFGFRLHEPQASSGIAHFSHAGDMPELKANRCKSLIRALIPNEPSSSNFLHSLKSATGFYVAAEDRIDNSSMRIDLLISWRDENCRRYRQIVEMKFDHKLTKGQLEKYGRDALQNVDDPEHLRLVLLTLDGAFSRADRRSLKELWHPLSWLNFLRHWEAELVSDHDNTFIAFRRQLWARIGA
ncbi:PD-(D/E)XK nuclease family protein [Endozoicomonas sp. G2_2]|nr:MULTISPECIES: PD-(D/E)XK nuclease family protein [Gammaproteobacteria]MAS09631.1 hypothetical protein [Salinisphaera sp.]MAS10231.1 hypothetical protein [Salinisphaera sp.]MBO9470696.1 PD-(D/E)XK nuclease family protein [Endozoicomonas sp. G2_2]|tara:strand:+ start:416 stop:1201 length:786 start_codon:yes stop_codon:yes gene_type:complete